MSFEHIGWLWLLAFLPLSFFISPLSKARRFKQQEKFADPKLWDSVFSRAQLGANAIRKLLFALASVALIFALAGPRLHKGTRIIPAGNLDIVLAFDFSKSMFAEDIKPSRLLRAKLETSRLIRQIPGARFGAVAFAGTAMSFPMTADGSAVSHFLKGLTPHDMPVGGTNIAEALSTARQLLETDQKGKNHKRLVVLITDGEDLSEDAAQQASALADLHVTLHIVRIGGQEPVGIPDVDENGIKHGMRKTLQGKVLSTEFTPEGEQRLAALAAQSGGDVILAKDGSAGIDELSKKLRRTMKYELSERSERVFNDIGWIFCLGAAALLLLSSLFQRPSRRIWRGGALASLGLILLGCAEDERPVFIEHESPVVKEAINDFSKGEYSGGLLSLQSYLQSGDCTVEGFENSSRHHDRFEAAYDWAYGAYRELVGDKPISARPLESFIPEPAGPSNQAISPASATESSPLEKCARQLLSAVLEGSSSDSTQAAALLLRGNLELLARDLEAARDDYRSGLARWSAPHRQDPLSEALVHNHALVLLLLNIEKQQQEQQDKQNSDKQDQQDDGDKGDDENKDQDQQDDGDKGDDENKDQDKQDKKDEKDSKADEQKSDDSSSKDLKDSAPQSPAEKKAAEEKARAEHAEAAEYAKLSDEEKRQIHAAILDRLDRAETVQPLIGKAEQKRFSSMEDK